MSDMIHKAVFWISFIVGVYVLAMLVDTYLVLNGGYAT